MVEALWFKTSNDNGVYYSPFSSLKKRYRAMPNGSVEDMQKIADYLNKSSRADYEQDGLICSRTDELCEAGEPLPAGVYRYAEENFSGLPDRLIPVKLREDKYIDLGGVFKKVEGDIQKFLNGEQFYKDRNFSYRLGILLYGPPGMGKSVFLRKLIEQIAPEGAYTVFLKSMPSRDFLDKVRSSMKDSFKIFIFEELVTATKSDSDVELMLNFLDGEDSISNSMVLATTNHADKLPLNIVSRPSRFDKLYLIDNPGKEEIKQLLTYYLDREPYPTEIDLAVGLSVAELKEASLLVGIHEMLFGEAVKSLKDRKKLCEKAFAKPTEEVGFGRF
jgi:SpoVK/Ycf46/Vps4 family AAA+-type ATPase